MINLKKDISNLPDTLRNKAAKRCIDAITQYSFTESVSKVTLNQLLALSYLVIHDDEKRESSREDAYNQFIEGLYEIQRGQNLSAEGIDDQRKDSSICLAGMFNKLIEKLSGIYPDVELIYITNQTAGLKLPIIVREELKKYLEELSNPKTIEGFHYFITLINELFEEGIEIIWNKIKPRVAESLFDEFKSLYQYDRKNLNFLSLVNTEQYVELNNIDLTGYQQQLLSSTGYRKYCSQIIQKSRFFSLGTEDFLSKNLDVNYQATKKENQNWLIDSEKRHSSAPRSRGR